MREKKRRHDDAHKPGQGAQGRRAFGSLQVSRANPLLPEAACGACLCARSIGDSFMCENRNSYRFGGIVEAGDNCEAFKRKE